MISPQTCPVSSVNLSIMHKQLILVICNPVFVSLSTTSNSFISLYKSYGF